MKYFKNVKSYEDLKNQFKALVKINHPDAGGDPETMKAINCEYDGLFPIWKDRHNKTAASPTTETAQSTRRKFYTEYGWEGERYDSRMTTTDISKAIKVYTKEKYPTWKFSVTSKYFSGGSSILICLMEAPIDIFDRDYFGSDNRRDCWNIEKMDAEKEYHMQLHSIRDRREMPYLNDIGYEVLNDVYSFMQSYNYDDSDSIIDYFSCNFYSSINIGKWNKGLKLVPKAARIKKQKETTVPATTKAGDYDIKEDEHTKTGEKLWVVKLLKKLSRAEYLTEASKMKAAGGYYSKFKHGFIFKNDPSGLIA